MKLVHSALMGLLAILALPHPVTARSEDPVDRGSTSVWVVTGDELLELDPSTGAWETRLTGTGAAPRIAIYGEAARVWAWDGAQIWLREGAATIDFEPTAIAPGCAEPILQPTERGALLTACPDLVSAWSRAGAKLWQWVAPAPIEDLRVEDELLRVTSGSDDYYLLDSESGLEQLDIAAPPERPESDRLATRAVDPRNGEVWSVEGALLVRRAADGQVLARLRIPSRQAASRLELEIRPTPLEPELKPTARGSRPQLRPRSGFRKSLPSANLNPDESEIAGELYFDDQRPAVGAEVRALRPPLSSTITGPGGTFLTAPFLNLESGQVGVLARKATVAGPTLSGTPLGASPGQTTSSPLYLDFACPVGFSAGLFPAGDLNGDVRALSVFDDGSGPALFVGGTFTTARGVTVNRVAKWNGSTWSALGSGLAGTSASVDALVVFDDGTGARLYAGGNFTLSGAATVRYVAKWTGSSWTQVGSNLGAQVLALAVHNPGTGNALYAGGAFTTNSRIARLSGSSWVGVGTGANGTVRALASFDDGTGAKLYAGGAFTTAGGIAANRIARWNGTAWSALGGGLTGGSSIQANALAVHTDESGTRLYVGGRFNTAGGVTANHVARWTGTTWEALDVGLAASVNALASYDDGRGSALYAGGSFTTISGEAFNRLARWNGIFWAPIGAGANNSVLGAATGSVGGDGALFAGGSFSSVDGLASTRVARLLRPDDCEDLFSPTLAFVEPVPGSTTSSATPTIRLGAADLGSGLDLASLAILQNGNPITASCTFADPIFECTPTAPLQAGAVTLSATIEDLDGNLSASAQTTFTIADDTPPTIAFVEPTEGQDLTVPRPALRFSYSDSGSGVDGATLIVTFDGLATTVECSTAAATAVCVPTTDLPNGSRTARATVRDVQGNLSTEAVRSFSIVASPPAQTTFVGDVRYEDGTPAAGARVWLSNRPTPFELAAADGSFSLAGVAVGDLPSVELTGRLIVSGVGNFLGFVTVPPVVGGITPVTLTLRRKCDGFFSPLALVAEGSTLTAVPFSISNAPRSYLAFDSGTGAELYVGGAFNYGSAGELERIARWTATGWSSLGSGLGNSTAGIQPDARALAVFDEGTGPELFVAGQFTAAGGLPAAFLAAWDGTGWREAGGGTDDRITGLAVFDDGAGPVLFAAGEFTRVGTRVPWTGEDRSIAAANVAIWNGTSWQDAAGGIVPSNPSTVPLRLSVLASATTTELYLWEEGGPQIWQRIAGSWQSVALPPAAYGVRSLALFDDGGGPALHLHAAGAGIVKRTGGSWQTIYGDDSQSKRLAAFADAQGSFLYAAGYFVDLPGYDNTAQLHRWNGSSWSGALGPATEIHRVDGLGANPTLLRGEPLARFEAGAWVPLASTADVVGSVTSVAFALPSATEGVLFAGPSRVGALELDGAIAFWDGTSVVEATTGLPGGNKVFSSSDGLRARIYGLASESGQVAEWNGSGWSPLGSPLGAGVREVDWVEVAGERRLYAAGAGLWRWNGAFWQPIAGAPALVTGIEGLGGQLYTNNYWRFNGSTWSTISAPPALVEDDKPESATGLVHSEALDGSSKSEPPSSELVAGATCSGLESFGGKLHFANRYWAWSGSAWVAGIQPRYGYIGNRFLSPTESQSTISGSVCVLEGFDDGWSEQLLVGGDFAAQKITTTTSSVLPYRNVNLGRGVDGPSVNAVATGTWRGAPAVALGGGFGETRGAVEEPANELAGRLAIWHPAPEWSTCSTAGQPPVITIDQPVAGLTNLAAVTIAGHLDEPGTLTVEGAAVPVSAERQFSFASGALREGENHFHLEATDRTDLTGSFLYTLRRDSVGPAVSIVAPAQGASVFSATPAIDLRFEESGSGIEPGTLVVAIGGAPLALAECQVRDLAARCRPATPLADGPTSITARIADRAGNLSTIAAVSVTIAAGGGTGTTVSGTVQFEGGAPAPGARVRLLGRAGVETTTLADGSFALPVDAIEHDRPLQLVAEATQGAQTLMALSPLLVPVPGGTTPAGVLTLGLACDLEFSPDLFGSVGVPGRVFAAAVFDDGTGPALYLGGENLVGTASLARWTGSRWEPVPGASVSDRVRALVVFDDGTGPALYVGGHIDSAGGAAAAGIARWDGTAWDDLDGGLLWEGKPPGGTCTTSPGSVYALHVFDDGSGPALYAGGSFAKAGAGTPAHLVARWTAAGWSGIGAPGDCYVVTPGATSPVVHALASFDEGSGAALFAAGSFASIAGIPARRVARLLGGSWSPLGTGVGRLVDGVPAPSMVNALAVFDSGDGPELVAAGLFNQAGDLASTVASIARWNGTRWAPLGPGLGVSYTQTSTPVGIQALSVYDDGSGPELYAAGYLSGPFSVAYGSIARWNGLVWSPVEGELRTNVEGGMLLMPWNGELLVGGDFDSVAGFGVNNVASWNGSRWSAFGNGLDGPVEALAMFDDGTGPALYLGGSFLSGSGRTLNRIARWDGAELRPLGSGFDGTVYDLEVHDDGTGIALYAGGRFDLAGGSAAKNVARWDGLDWSPLGAGLYLNGGSAAYVYSLEPYDDGSGLALYAGGIFDRAGSATASRIARWSAGQWSTVGSGTNNSVSALARATVAGTPALFVGGSFTTAGGLSASRIARWNGSWSALGSGVTSTVSTLLPWNGSSLLAGGSFSSFTRLWNGTTWSTLAGGSPNAAVASSALWNDGRGPAAYFGGSFTSIPGLTGEDRIARWSGTAWSTLATGMNTGSVQALAAAEEPTGAALYLGGSFTTADGILSTHLARWTRPIRCGDDDGPVVTIAAPLAGSWVRQTRPAISFTMSDIFSGVDPATIALRVDGQPIATSCSTTTSEATCYPDDPLAQGARQLLVSVDDTLGNTGSASVAFSVDSIDPAVDFFDPIPEAILTTSTPTVRFGLSDAGSGIGMNAASIELDGTVDFGFNCSCGTEDCECVAAAPIEDSRITFLVTLEDLAGNVAEDVEASFYVDTAAPDLEILHPTDGSTVYQPVAAIGLGYLESGSGVDPASVLATLDGAPLALDCSALESTADCAPAVPIGVGSHTLAISIADRAGQRSSVASSAFSILIDDQGPTLAFSQPANGSVFNPQTTPFVLAWSDAVSGVDAASLSVQANGLPVALDCTTNATGASCRIPQRLYGAVTLRAQMADVAGNVATPALLSISVPGSGPDTTPPAIVPHEESLEESVRQSPFLVRGTLSEPATLTVDGQPVTVFGDRSFRVERVLQEGSNSILLVATDFASNQTQLTLLVELDTIAPAGLDDLLLTVGPSVAGKANFQGAAGCVLATEPVLFVSARSRQTGAEVLVPVALDRSFSGFAPVLPGDVLELRVVDAAGNASDAEVRDVEGTDPTPPEGDPSSTGSSESPFCLGFSFLWLGDSPVQFGTAEGAIDCDRVTVFRGQVLDAQGLPLSGVRVSAPREPGAGIGLSRADGGFDFAVNGGAAVLLEFGKAGFAPVQRFVDGEWLSIQVVDTLILTSRDSATTEIDLQTQVSMQSARGSSVTDAAGTRRATLLVPQGVSAEVTLGDGSKEPLTNLTLRATELTVGEALERRLPGPLPRQMDPTYVVELTVDEAETLNAERVSFSQPLPFYFENFVGFEVGTRVASAWWDREAARWVAADDGRVIEVLAELGGIALVDVEGDGDAADSTALAALGISTAELQQLATLYEPGQELVRGRVDHFTPWYWGLATLHWVAQTYGPPAELPLPATRDEHRTQQPSLGRFGGIVDAENQILGQSLGVVGSPVGLEYRSDRVPGRRAPYQLVVPLTGETLPPGLTSIEVVIDSAGRRSAESFLPQPNLTTTIEWDGVDAYGRTPSTPERWTARVSYLSGGAFAPPEQTEAVARSFELPAGRRIDYPSRGGKRISRISQGVFPAFDAREAFGLGGWSLGILHRFDALHQTVFFGGGGQRAWAEGPEAKSVLVRVAGNFEAGDEGDEGPAREASLTTPYGVSPTRDGGLLIADADNCRIRKVAKDGTITTVAGSGCAESPGGPLGDGGLAVDALLAKPHKAVEGPDGRIVIADTRHGRLRVVAEDGTISTLADLNAPGCTAFVNDVDVDGAGNAVVAVTAHGSWPCMSKGQGIWRVTPSGQKLRDPDQTWTGYLRGVDILADGRTLVSFTGCLFEHGLEISERSSIPGAQAGRCGPYINENGPYFRGDGDPASWDWTRFNGNEHIAVATDGTVYVADSLNGRVRAIAPNGIVNTIAGGGGALPNGDGFEPTQVALFTPTGVALSPDGRTLYIADAAMQVVWKMATPSPKDDGEYEIPSGDGSVLYVFDRGGHHLRTEDGTTRRTLWEFEYQEYPSSEPAEKPRRYVTEIRDAFDNVITVERSGDGSPLAIVAPFGQRTELIVDPSSGYLAEVSRTVGATVERVELTSTPDGLLESLEDPRDGVYTYTWDDLGRLERIDDPANGSLLLEPVEESEEGRLITRTSTLGRSNSVELEFLPKREIRWTTTSSSGQQSSVLERKNGTFELSGSDGSSGSASTRQDPILGPLVSIGSAASASTPSGLSMSVSQATLSYAADPSDPLVTRSRTETVTVNGRTSETRYDGVGRTITSTSPEGRQVVALLDEYGRVHESQAPGVPPVKRFFDSRGRLERVEQGSGPGLRQVLYTYDPATGDLDTVTDTLGRTVAFEYDEAGRVTKQILPDLREIALSYDANGNVTSVTPPTRPPHEFDYTVVDQVELYTPPDAGFSPRATSYLYNDDRQLTTVTRPDGQVVSIAYEPNGRTDMVTFPGGVIDVAYDGTTGQVDSISAPGGMSAFFDYDGPLVTGIETTGPVPGTVEFDYDNDFAVTAIAVVGGATTDLDYDDDGLLTQAGSLVLSRNAANGQLETTTLGVTTDSRTRTAFAELDVFTASVGGTAAYVYDLDRDASGRITKKTETLGGVTSVWEYAYHPDRGWLTEVKKDAVVVETYGYDPNGNRTSWTDFWGSGSATHDDQDRQLTAGTASFTYTANGERLTKTVGSEVTTYEYDVRGALLSVDLPSGIAIEYLVDAGGRRIGKKVNGVLTKGWLYAGGLSPLAELDGSGSITRTFVYATKGNVPDAMIEGGTTYRLVTDHLGSVRLVVNASTGAITQRLDYDAYGRITFDSNPGHQPFGFAGGIYDPQTGLVRFGARDYDPETGRWTAKDPIGFAGGVAGLFEYAANSPVNSTDPTGLQPDRYHGMMREFAENPQMMEYHWKAGRNAVIGVAVVAATVGASIYLAESALVASSYCLINPNTCTEIGVAAAELAAGVDGPTVGPFAAPRRVFWSGGRLAEKAAAAFAAENGAETLGMTALGRATVERTRGLDYLTEAKPVWAESSREFARGAFGEIHVFRSTDVDIDSIWLTVELPELIENSSVTRFIFHDVLPDGTVITH